MTELLVKAANHFLEELSEEQEHVYADFLLLQSDYHGAGREWLSPEQGGRLDEVSFQGERWPIVWCDSELNLRREILRAPAGKALLLFPADAQDPAVPPDIRARAHRGMVHTLGLRHLLAAETGSRWPPDVDYSEWRPAILRHRQELVNVASRQILNVTRDQLEALLVKAAFGLTINNATPAELLVRLYLYPIQRSPLPLELEILQGQLALHELPHAEIVRWVAERPDRAQDFLTAGAMMRIENQLGLVPSWGPIQPLQGQLLKAYSQQEALEIILDLAWKGWKELPGNNRRQLMKLVEERLATYVDLNRYNDVSPRSLRYRINEVAQKLAGGQPATAVIEEMNQHLFAGDERLALDTLQRMDEVLGWREVIIGVIDKERSAVEWVEWYRHQGAFADLAALQMKIDSAKKLSQQVDAILALYWEARNPINEAFAQGLLTNYESTLYHPEIISTHKVLDRLVLPMLHEQQRVLLVVLDGMSYSGLIYLVEHLSQERASPVGIAANYAGLSILPSVTAASRKAIFLGQRPTDTLDSDEVYEEKAKTTEHKALVSACRHHRVVLHNQSSLSGQDGELQLFNDVINREIELVALILNQVDDDLKGGREPRLYGPDELGVFYEAVNDALRNGRRVLVVADHGHTWHRDKSGRVGAYVAGGSHRHIPLSDGEAPPDVALSTDDPEIVPKDQPGSLAFLYRVGDYFGTQPQRGYHGGASLEEMVIPCVELNYGGRALVPGKTSGQVQAEVGQQKVVHETISDPASATGIVLTLVGGERLQLALPELSQRETQALQLLARVGRANEQQLRSQLGTRRVSGLMSKLMEKLGRAGFELIEIEPAGVGGMEYLFKQPLEK